MFGPISIGSNIVLATWVSLVLLRCNRPLLVAPLIRVLRPLVLRQIFLSEALCQKMLRVLSSF